MSKFRTIWYIIGFLWTNRKRFGELKQQMEEVRLVVQKALEDKNMNKDELVDILMECRDVLDEAEKLII